MRKETFEIINKMEERHWWFRVKRRLVILLLKKYSKNRKDLCILDIGCGTGLVSKALQPFGEIHSLDPSEDALQFCQQKGLQNLHQGTIHNLPFKNQFFDVVIALDVLEHVRDDQGAVNEIKRVLKEGGIFICFVPAFLFLWSKQDEILMHQRRYTCPSLSVLFSTGWQCLKISYFNFFLFPAIFLARIIKNALKSEFKDEAEQLSLLNKIFYQIFKLELKFLPYFSFPFGVSLLAVYKKNKTN